MPQLFSNNATTTLAAGLSDIATSMTVTSAAAFAAVSAPDFELVTLTALGAVEIVKVTAQSGTTWTIERAQEGTSAQAWDSGVTVEARATAGTLDGMMQAGAFPDLSDLDQDGDARGSSALNLQPGRDAAATVASGANATALGRNTKASATDATAVGNNASATGAYSVALGSNAVSPGQGGFAVGYAASASGQDSVSIGANSDATQTYSVAIGEGSQATGAPSTAIGRAAGAAGASSVAVGGNSDATMTNAVAIGENAQATSADAVAIGKDSAASAQNAVAIGLAVAQGSYSVSVGALSRAEAGYGSAFGYRAKAFGFDALALGSGANAFAERSKVSRGWWEVPTDDWNDQYEQYSSGNTTTFATPNVDLGVAPNWSASTVYAHGQVVKPTGGGTVQYRAWCDWDSVTFLHITPTSDATEPTWPGAGDNIAINGIDNAEWIGIDLSAGYETEAFPAWLEFWPSGIAFICQEYSSTTGTPTISVGTPSSPTLILNAASCTITAVGQVYHFTLPNPCPRIPEGESILITLDGAASAGSMQGRFVFTGEFVATRSRA
jgi:hypothetical protein